MAKTMLGAALREITGLLQDLFAKLSGENGQEWLEALRKFLRGENPWPAVTQAVQPKLLEFVNEVNLPAIGSFSAKAHFKVGETKEVKIGWLGDNFSQAFLSDKGKVESNVAAVALRIHKLLNSSVDAPIIAELGGEEVAETTLTQMWQLLARQGHGEKGDLLVNGCANIFYIRDANGVLWAVRCRWFSGNRDWSVEACSVALPSRWDAGSQVVSR